MSVPRAAVKPEPSEVRLGNWYLAIVLGLVAVLFLILAVSAPWWLEADLERLGYTALMSQYGGWEQLGVTIWMFAVPLAVLFGATAAAVVSRARPGRVAVFVAAAVIAIITPIILGNVIGEVIAPIFGLGGVIIELALLVTLWFWARERASLSGRQRLVVDLRLGGLGMFAAAAWFVCGMLAMPVFGLDPAKQIAVGTPDLAISMAYGLLAYLVLGWVLTAGSQVLAARGGAGRA